MSVRIKITAGGIYNAEGKEIEVGSELTLKDEPTAWAGRYETISGGDTKAKKAVTNPQKAKKAVTFEAKAKGDAWVITDSDGAEHGTPLTEADATAFNGMSDDDKAAFAADQKPAA